MVAPRALVFWPLVKGNEDFWARIGAGLTFKSSHDAHAQDRRRVLSELKNKDNKNKDYKWPTWKLFLSFQDAQTQGPTFLANAIKKDQQKTLINLNIYLLQSFP